MSYLLRSMHKEFFDSPDLDTDSKGAAAMAVRVIAVEDEILIREVPNRASTIAPTAASSNHRQIQALVLVLDPPISVSTSRTIVVPPRLRVPVSSH